ncbi:MAG: hypothetical protein CL842_05565 [Crocinitomicaceae bacterium]|nr:hypothetical protein [Crocinitomicaceae bacterium]
MIQYLSILLILIHLKNNNTNQYIKTMFDMNKSLEEQTEPVLRALLNLHKTEEGRQKIIDILHKHNHENTGTQRRPLKRN